MKTVGIVFIALLVLALAAFVVIQLNQPAAVAFRKAFRVVTGYTVMPSEDVDALLEQNKVLLQKQRESESREAELIALNEQLLVGRDKDKEEVAKLLNKVKQAEQEVQAAKEVFQTMTPVEQVMLFDRLTEGTKPTIMATFMGEKMAGVQLERFKSAVWLLYEGQEAIKQNKDLREVVERQAFDIVRLEGVNANNGLIIGELREQLALEKQKNENCEELIDAAIKKGTKRALGGGAIALIALAVMIL